MKRLLYILALIISLHNFAQDSVAVSIKDSTIRIGEQTLLNLEFYYSTIDTLDVVWPEFDNFITNEIEIIDKSDLKTSPLDSTSKFNFLKTQSFIVTSFEPNRHVIPTLEFTHFDSTYLSNELNLNVNTLEVDTTKGLTDIKPIYEVDYPLTERIADYVNWWFILIWFLILFLLAVIVTKITKHRNRLIEEKTEPKIIIPAHIKALEVLNELKKNSAWESDNKKQYYSDLTDAVRLYLEDRYKIQALEKTTKEIITELKFTNISVDDKYFLKEILRQADFVKFAKFTPSSDDGLNALNKSFEFVEKTKAVNIESKNTDDNVE
jgi:hypothetical protein